MRFHRTHGADGSCYAEIGGAEARMAPLSAPNLTRFAHIVDYIKPDELVGPPTPDQHAAQVEYDRRLQIKAICDELGDPDHYL